MPDITDLSEEEVEKWLRDHSTLTTTWQDIKTAPKDIEVLVWNGRRRHVAQWDRIDNAWVTPYRTTTKRLHVLPEPTHWQPLPGEPKS